MTTVIPAPGAVGTATAWYLSKAGHDVEVVDASRRPRWRTSWGNGGVIHASEVEPWSQPGMPRKIIPMAGQGERAAAAALRRHTADVALGAGLRTQLHAREVPRQFPRQPAAGAAFPALAAGDRRRAGIAYDRGTNGVMKIYRSNDALDAAARSCAFLAQHGLLFERIGRERCVDLEPALADTGPTLAGGLYFARTRWATATSSRKGLAAPAPRAACATRYAPA